MLGRGLVIVEVRLRPNEQELFTRHHADAVGHELFAVARAEMTLVRVASLELHRTVITVEWRFSSVTALVLLETVSTDKQKILLVLLLLPHLFNDLFSRQPGQTGTRKVKLVWIYMKQEKTGIWDAVTLARPNANRLVTTPTPHHSIFRGRTIVRHPTNSVKALKAIMKLKQIH